MRTALVAPVAAIIALALTGCSASTPSAETKTEVAAPAGASGASGPTAVKRYPMKGKVLSVNAAEKSARIDAGPIGDWMGAMTMNYTFKDPADLAKLKVGADFDATVFVQGDDFWVGEVK